MTRRLLTLGALFAVAATACSTTTLPPVEFPAGVHFVPTVADAQDDMGYGNATAVAEDGTIYVSYFGFPEVLQEGEVALLRPVGSPFLPAVALTSISPDGIYSRGAVEQFKAPSMPNGVSPPFQPESVPDLNLTRENVNGTDVAVAPDGTIHVVWAGADGIYHATAKTGEAAAVDQVYDLGYELEVAGPLGRPSVTVDEAGVPWVAFTVSTPTGDEVDVASPKGDTWSVDTIATIDRCIGCPPPLPTGITASGGAPLVVFVDPGGGVESAFLDGKRWELQQVSPATAAGLAVAGDGDTAYASYFTEDGTVALSTFSGGTWTTADVADAPFPDTTTGVEAPTTDVSASGSTVAVTWQDDHGVQLASGESGKLQPNDTPGTEGGIGPSLAVASKGGIALSWVNPTNIDLMVGILGEPGDLLVANPSPAPTVSLAPPAPPSNCGDDKKVDLDIAAVVGNAFDKNCLVAPAGANFTVSFNNQETTAHNIAIYTEQGGDRLDGTDITPGPTTETLDDGPLDAGTYFFQCDAHPTEMYGSFAVVKGAK